MRRFLSLFVSFGMHAAILTALVATGFLVHHEVKVKKGSPAFSLSSSTTTLMLVTPHAPADIAPAKTLVTEIAPAPAAKPPVILPHEDDVPALPVSEKMADANPASTSPSPLPAKSTSKPPAPKHAAERPAPVASSFAAGENALPHPPYPEQARNLKQAGTVVMDVEFDQQGAVAHAQVEQSSGVRELDSSTRSYICAHWHSAAYAGQTISVPVQYKLEKL